MLKLSGFCFSKEIWSVGCDARNEWYFGGPDKELYVRVPDIY